MFLIGKRACWSFLCVAGFLLGSSSPILALTDFVEFESGAVRPIAMSVDGTQLFVTNIPDNRLEIFDVTVSGLVHSGSVPVGMEPRFGCGPFPQRSLGGQPSLGQRQHHRPLGYTTPGRYGH